MSEKELYHAHVALYGNTTTLGNVAKIMFDSHIEPQLGGKKELMGYLLKEPPYEEKGEQVLYTMGLENIQEKQGSRSDLEEISYLLESGYTPMQIMEQNFAYRRFEKMIKSAFVDKRIRETPVVKEMHTEWHVGASGSGKTYYYCQLCEKYSPEDIYLATDFENGGFDFYIEQGAPSILFMDEFKGNMKFSQLLTILDKYSRTQTHCRYANTFNLWTTVIVTSVYPPEEAYSIMVNENKRSRDAMVQLIRRFDTIVYHYVEDGEYKTFSVPGKEYIDYEDLKTRAIADENGFIHIEQGEDNPFNKEEKDV